MLLLCNTTDKLQIITDAAVNVDVHVSYVELNSSTFAISGSNRQLTAITTATTTDVLAAPGATTCRNAKTLHVRNKSTTTSVGVTVQYNANGTLYELHAVTLRAGESLEYIEGVGFFVLGARLPSLPAPATSDQSIGASATAYLAGSGVVFPAGLTIGTVLRWTVSVAKSAAATATESWTVRFGTAGTTADTAQLTFTGDTETAAADEALVTVLVTVRGPISAVCVAQGIWNMDNNLSTTGFSNTARKAQVRVATSSTFDITSTPQIIGLALATGASHAITIRQCVAEVLKY